MTEEERYWTQYSRAKLRRNGRGTKDTNWRIERAETDLRLISVDPARPGVPFPHLSIRSYGPNKNKIAYYKEQHAVRLRRRLQCNVITLGE